MRNKILLLALLCLETLFSYPPDSDVYIFAWLPQLTNKILEVPKIVATSCLTSTSHKSPSSSQGAPEDCDKNIFNASVIHGSHLHLFGLSSAQLNNQADSDCLINYKFPMTKMTLMQKKSRRKVIMTLLKLNLIHIQILRFLRINIYQQLTVFWWSAETSSINLRNVLRTNVHWSLMIMVNYPLSQLIHCMFTMQMLTMFHLILQTIHIKILLG